MAVDASVMCKLWSLHVSGLGLTAAAGAAGMSKRTVWRRLQDPDVIELIGEVEVERRASLLDWSRMVRSLADLVTDAVVHVL